MEFQVWDFPGHLNYTDPLFDHAEIFNEPAALIWVIDAQEERGFFYSSEAITQLIKTQVHILRNNLPINVEVFVHKMDGLSTDHRSDIFNEITQRVQEELSDAGYEEAPTSFYQTSIYDHSIFEAFSKVIQKLVPQLPTLETLLTSLCANCGMEKAYLFDVLSKIYIATDTAPTDMASYEICSDYIDVVVDIAEIYGWDRPDDDELDNQDAESQITTERGGHKIYLYLREMTRHLALVCVMGGDVSASKKAQIDYNVGILRKALKEVFQK